MATTPKKQLRSASDSTAESTESDFVPPKLSDRKTDELVFALVGPVGSGCTTTSDILSDVLKKEYGYEVFYYRLSDFVATHAHLVGEKIKTGLPEEDRIEAMQRVGDKLREKFDDFYLVGKAIEKIAMRRDDQGFAEASDGRRVPEKVRHAHIIDSLKHPDELNVLRATYGDILWVVGAFAPFAVREHRLRYQKHLSQGSISAIMQRDYSEGDDHGQNVRDVFHQSDYFVRNDKQNKTTLSNELSRFLELIFGAAIHTPTIHESSMYAAYAEAARSACLSRQVGAAIVNTSGDLIGTGRNDVPKYGGGLYEETDGEEDHRCFAWGDKLCHNDAMKSLMYEQIRTSLNRRHLLDKDARRSDVTDALKDTNVKALIEFSRAVHAEMEAIISVARNNKPGLVKSALYSTTLPCHSCSRHIVASGIEAVYYIEPYPKSLTSVLHSDATSEKESDLGKKVVFLQYSGVAPKNILKLFNTGLTRKTGDGRLAAVDKKGAFPIVGVPLDDYATHEQMVVAQVHRSELAKNEEATQPAQATITDTRSPPNRPK